MDDENENQSPEGMNCPENQPEYDEEEQVILPASKIVSLAELMKMNLSAKRQIVEHLLPTGVAIFVAPPKSQKSFMALDLAISTASGTLFLGQRTNKCDVLYLALEDSFSRVQDRAARIMEDRTFDNSCDILTYAPRLERGLIGELEDYLVQKPKTGLIIIDTFQMIRDCQQGNRYSYPDDYNALKGLKEFADKHDICVLAIHHTRKRRDHNDPFNDISGTNGIMGAADTIWVLEKDKRTDDEATLSITGRDIIQDQLTIRFDSKDCRWHLTGRTKEILEAKARMAYDHSPIVRTIKTLVYRSADRSWKGYMKSLMNEGKAITNTDLAPSTRKLSSMVSELEVQLEKNDGILHTRGTNGDAGAEHTFWLSQNVVGEAEETTLDTV